MRPPQGPCLSFFFFYLSLLLLLFYTPNLPSSTPRPPPQSKGLAEEGSSKRGQGFYTVPPFFFSCLHRLLQGRVLQRGNARIRRFFFLTPSILRFIRTCTIALSLLSPPPKKRKTKAVSSLLQLSWLEGGLLCCWEKKKSSQNL